MAAKRTSRRRTPRPSAPRNDATSRVGERRRTTIPAGVEVRKGAVLRWERTQVDGTYRVHVEDTKDRQPRTTPRKRPKPTKEQLAARKRLLAGTVPLTDDEIDALLREAVTGRTGWVMTGEELDAAIREGRDE